MGILDWLFGGNDEAIGSTVAPAIIEQRIEQIVRIINPRLKLVPGYRRKLFPAVEQAVLYCREIEAKIPPAIEASATVWAENPTLRALFATARDIPEVFSRSRAVRDFFEATPGAEHVWATLRFLCREATGFGMAAEGGVVRHEVAQTCVSFADKKVVLPSGCEHDARLEIRRRAFKFLLTEVLQQITSVDMQRQDLKAQRSMLQARLMILKGQRVGLEAMLEEEGAGGRQKIEDVERKLSENERALAAFPGTGETLEGLIGRVQEVLTHGPDYLRIGMTKLRLDQMNVLVPEGAGEVAVEIVLPKVEVKSAPVVSLLACRFPRSELIRGRRLLHQAGQLLG